VQTEMVREQVDAFLKQQVWEAKHQVEEAQAAHHILLGCLQRVKHEPRRMGKFKKESTFGGWARARASPPSNKASPEPKKPCIEATVGDACKRGKIEELYQENMQLKAALAASRADAAAATRKADTLQAKVDKLLQENGQLLFQATESQKESDELMLSAASKERLLMTKLKEKQQQIGHMQLERMELRRSLAQRGDANAVIRCLNDLQSEYDKLVREHAQLQQAPRLPFAKFSAEATCAEPLVLGIEAEEEAARGDVTEDYAKTLADTGCHQAFHVGRVRIPVDAGSVPVCAKVTVANNGDSPWPETVVATLVSGDAFGCPLVALGSAQPGEHLDLSLDLLVPEATEPGVASSMWALVNAATGRPLGPLLIFEAASDGVWTEA